LLQLDLPFLILQGDYRVLNIEHVFALQLLQLEAGLFGLMGLIKSDDKQIGHNLFSFSEKLFNWSIQLSR
jgi:hypothetical protein